MKLTESVSIINAVKSGDPIAQRKLYNDYRGLWFSICLRYMNSRDDALDALQNGLIKIYSKLDQLDLKKGSFKSWSSKILVNECIMYQRKYWNHNSTELSLEVSDPVYESKAYSNMALEELSNVIQTLPVGYKLVFNLYEIEGFSHAEIAKKLDVSVNTSKTQLHKAKKLLKRKLELRNQIEVKLKSHEQGA